MTRDGGILDNIRCGLEIIIDVIQGVWLLSTWNNYPAVSWTHRFHKAFWFHGGPKIPSCNSLQNKDLLVLLLLMRKVRNGILGKRRSFLLLTLLYGLHGIKIKNKKIKAWAVEVRFIIPLRRTFIFQELLIRLKRKRRKSKGVEEILHYPVWEVNPVQPFSLRKFK